MTSPSPRPHGRKPSLASLEDSHYHSHLHTRTGTLTSMMRSRSQQSLTSPRAAAAWHSHHISDDDEPPRGRSRPRAGGEDDDIERLLRDETRLTQILQGPQVRSMNLIGKSNPRYRWERYWKDEDQLESMSKPM